MKIGAVGLTGGVAHYARYFCIDLCRFYFSSCTCVAACLVRYYGNVVLLILQIYSVVHDSTI